MENQVFTALQTQFSASRFHGLCGVLLRICKGKNPDKQQVWFCSTCMQVSKTQQEEAYKLTELADLCHVLRTAQAKSLLHTGANSSRAACFSPRLDLTHRGCQGTPALCAIAATVASSWLMLSSKGFALQKTSEQSPSELLHPTPNLLWLRSFMHHPLQETQEAPWLAFSLSQAKSQLLAGFRNR